MTPTRPLTYWNGERCDARRVRVVVADDGRFPDYWARGFVGSERDAVEVSYDGRTFYLDDEGYQTPVSTRAVRAALGLETADHTGYPGWGWAKITTGYGGGQWGHADLQVERVIGER